MTQCASVTITVHGETGPGAAALTPGELDELTGALREELLLLPVESVEKATDAAASTAGTKSGVPQAVGTLVVAGVFSGATVKGVASVITAWLQRAAARSVTVEIEGGGSVRKVSLTGASKSEVDRLLALWPDGQPAEPEPEQPGEPTAAPE